MLGFHVLWGHSIDGSIIVFYTVQSLFLNFLLPYPTPIPKPTTHTKRSAFLDKKKKNTHTYVCVCVCVTLCENPAKVIFL